MERATSPEARCTMVCMQNPFSGTLPARLLSALLRSVGQGQMPLVGISASMVGQTAIICTSPVQENLGLQIAEMYRMFHNGSLDVLGPCNFGLVWWFRLVLVFYLVVEESLLPEQAGLYKLAISGVKFLSFAESLPSILISRSLVGQAALAKPVPGLRLSPHAGTGTCTHLTYLHSVYHTILHSSRRTGRFRIPVYYSKFPLLCLCLWTRKNLYCNALPSCEHANMPTHRPLKKGKKACTECRQQKVAT